MSVPDLSQVPEPDDVVGVRPQLCRAQGVLGRIGLK
jgi:hypothetical protein